MPRKPAPKPDDPEQSKRFIETAREIGTDEDPEAFERAFKKVIPDRPHKTASQEHPGRNRSQRKREPGHDG
jgi:hypothetical protein